MKGLKAIASTCILGLLAGSLQAEYAWVRFHPERPGHAVTPAFADGWQVIDQFEFESPNPGDFVAAIGLIGPVGPATPAMLRDVMDETVFDAVEIVLHTNDGQTRLLLERVRVADQTVHATAGINGPRENRLLVFEAITYIHASGADSDARRYSEVDIATGAGGEGTYIPRAPDEIPTFGATLRRDPGHPDQFTLSWKSEPGIQYDIEFSDDLSNPHNWTTIPVRQVFGGEGRLSTVTVTEQRGFYRVRER